MRKPAGLHRKQQSLQVRSSSVSSSSSKARHAKGCRPPDTRLQRPQSVSRQSRAGDAAGTEAVTPVRSRSARKGNLQDLPRRRITVLPWNESGSAPDYGPLSLRHLSSWRCGSERRGRRAHHGLPYSGAPWMIGGDSRSRFRPEQGFWSSERRVEVACASAAGLWTARWAPCPAIVGTADACSSGQGWPRLRAGASG